MQIGIDGFWFPIANSIKPSFEPSIPCNMLERIRQKDREIKAMNTREFEMLITRWGISAYLGGMTFQLIVDILLRHLLGIAL